jgi:transposase
MTISRAEVITSVERRRRWSQDEKERLVAASLEPGASVSEVARIAGLHVSQLFSGAKSFASTVKRVQRRSCRSGLGRLRRRGRWPKRH